MESFCLIHIIPYHIIAYPILSYHIISYHIISRNSNSIDTAVNELMSCVEIHSKERLSFFLSNCNIWTITAVYSAGSLRWGYVVSTASRSNLHSHKSYHSIIFTRICIFDWLNAVGMFVISPVQVSHYPAIIAAAWLIGKNEGYI